MKNILALIILLTSLTFGQSELVLFDDEQITRYAIDLDGSTEYLAKISPVNLDLNGSERITDTKNRDMNGAVDYTGNGNHSVIDSVTTDKHAGTYSMTINSSAGGDGTTNYVSLASNKFTTLVSGEKYTLEAWMRGTGIVSGADLCASFTNGTTNVYETFTTLNDSISSAIETGTNGAAYSNDLGSFTVGDQYQVTFNLTINSGAAPTVGFTATNNLGTTIGTFQTATAGTNTLYFYITATSTTPVLTFKNVSAANLTINDVDVKKITAPTCTLAIGNQTKVTTNISCVPVAANWTKVVWNFQATANEVNQPVKIYYNQADIVYVDDVSLTQAYDLMMNIWVNTSATTGHLFEIDDSRYFDGYYSSGNFNTRSNDGKTVLQISNKTGFTGAYKLITIIQSRSFLYLYKDGIKIDSSSANNFGSKIGTNGMFLGKRASGNPLALLLGETQITRFTDIATSNYTPAQIYQLGLNGQLFPSAYTGGVVTAWYTWAGDATTFDDDKSGTGNDLTGTNVTITDRVIR